MHKQLIENMPDFFALIFAVSDWLSSSVGAR